ncbi:carboxypeptidase regulatory-like domain-containing protein [Ottowia testudinis]|uniref:Carboxypeptidase regulatory-like domain-containing protein n=1 Tax=Ottowia testudinis TaxID=2816950 RepID=A0A975H516_9BURK|nr:carboxypeptidase regulatory-like domain-containing protein [Ottowia testudinis]QTD46965.1 carboxypeptidase regulatory-like domain-containing protein [Ottowia testudinis]
MNFVRPSLARLFCVALLSATVAACGGSDSDSAPAPSPAPSPAPVGNATINGRVTSSIDGSAVAGAKVTVGNASATTDASGNYSMSNAPVGERTVVRVNAAGFGEGFAVESTAANATRMANVRLQPVGGVTQGAGSGTVTATVSGSAAQVTIPANSVVDAAGTPVTGNYSVALTVINPAQDVAAMPGYYRVALPGGGVGQMESWGALNVTLTDATGKRLNLGSGKTATLRIPVATRSAELPATIPLFYFDEAKGLWVQEGSAALRGTGTSAYYEGSVGHFSYWNADRLLETVYVNGCVRSLNAQGQPANAADVQVTSDGIDYSGASAARTDAAGKFRLPVKRGGKAIVAGFLDGKITNSVTAGPANADITLPECLTLESQASGVSVKLTWGASPSDVDSHLVAPDGSHIYFGSQGSLTQAPFANLDVDDITSYGPEVVTIRRLMIGTYTYGLRNYSGSFNPGMTGSPVRVELNYAGRSQVFGPPAGEVTNSTDWLTLFNLTVDARCNISVTPVNRWSDGGLVSVPAPVVASYCTP